MTTALIVDDDPDFTHVMSVMLSQRGVSASAAASLQTARRQIATSPPDLVLLDLHLPDGDGLSLLRDPQVAENSEVVLMTGHASLESSIQALRQGATDYLVKPVCMAQLDSILARVMRPSQLVEHAGNLHEQLQRSGRFGPLVGRSGRMELVYEQIARVARSSAEVFISGETGTGKELASRTVHQLSRRRAGPFVAVHCSSLSPELLEGGRSGTDQYPGVLAQASGGTLFLDEICDTPPALQARLLRLLDDGRPGWDGRNALCEQDVRIIASTNREPEAAIASGALREDLFYRLNVFPIQMPALREHIEDLPLLTGHLLREISKRAGAAKQATPSALQRLSQYRWPGNVRELRNALQLAHVMTQGGQITHAWLPCDLAAPLAPVRKGEIFEVAAGTTLAQLEREVILATLESHGWQKERSATALGISLKTLYNRLKQYGH